MVRTQAGRVVAASLIALAMAVPVQAAPLEREHYSDTFEDTFDDCGFAVHVEGTSEGLFMLKEGRRGDPTPYLLDNYEAHETFTNVATGEWFTIDHQGMYKDLRITNVSGTIYTFVAIEAGQPFVVRDSDGDRFIFDRGLLTTTFMVDTKGDADLDNDEFIEASFQVVADRGAHPGFFIDFCEDLIQPLLG